MRPINGERTGPWPFPGKPPGQPPEQHHQRRRSTRGFSRSNLRRRQIVRGDRRGSRSSTHAPDEQGRRLAPDGTTVWTKTEHSSYAEKKQGAGTAGTPRKGRVRKPEKAPAPNHPLPIPRDPPDRDHPCALRHQAPAKTRQTGCSPRTQSIAEVSGPRPKMSSRGSLPLTEQPSGGFESATGEIWGGTAGPFPPTLKIDAIPPTRSTDRDQRRDRPRFRCPSAPRPCPWQPTFNEGLSTRSTR